MFKVNDKLVFRGRGVCVVKRIETKTFADKSKQFYVLGHDALTIFVPIDSDQIRPIASRAEIDKALDFLAYGDVTVNTTSWNTRYREYMEILNKGDIMDIAYVYRCLLILNKTKDLSFGERKMLDRAKELIDSEHAIAQALVSA